MIDKTNSPLAIYNTIILERAQYLYEQKIKANQPITPQGEKPQDLPFGATATKAAQGKVEGKRKNISAGVSVRTNKGDTVDYFDFVEDEEVQATVEMDGNTYGNVAIIEIKGFIQKETYWDWWEGRWVNGTERIGQFLNNIGYDDRIKAVMLKIDSGGGQVAGVETLSRTIVEFRRKYKKPVWAFVDGCACSAAYWIISGSDKIILSEKTSVVGSLGVLISITSFSEYYKDMGIVQRDIKASLSPNKNKAVEDAIKGNDALLVEQLDKVCRVFLQDVLNYRGAANLGLFGFNLAEATAQNIPPVLSGEVFYGDGGAQSVGLVDELTTVGFAGEVLRLQKYRKTSDGSTQTVDNAGFKIYE